MRALAAVGSAVALAGWLLFERRDAAALAADATAEDLAPVEGGRVLEVVSADGTRLHVEEHGRTDGPVVVLAHGWTCGARFWAPVVRRLADEARVVVYDQRGHGRSPATPGMGERELAQDLDAVLAAATADGNRAVLVGHSMGAMAAVAWAGAHPDRVPERVDAALLLSTRIDPLPVRRGAARASQLVVLRHPTPARQDWFWRRQLQRTSHSRGASAAAVRLSTELYAATPVPVRLAWGRFLEKLDLREHVARLDVPTTVLVGDRDVLTPERHGRWLFEHLPQPHRWVLLEGVGHSTPVDAPDAVAAEVRDLMALVGARRSGTS